MRIFRHKNRNLVVADLSENEDIPDEIFIIGRAGVDPTISGFARRGRKPIYKKMVKSNELEVVLLSDVKPEVLKKAEEMVSEAKIINDNLLN